MALTKVRGKGLGTLGDGTASDTAIVFDGNAQNFHIGLDDSADSLILGLGSTLGTTSHMVIDANGHITKPLQSAFLVQPSTAQLNFPINASTTIAYGTEIFDQNGDFSSNTFTAPVTGRYQLNINLYLSALDHDVNYYQPELHTSNRTYYFIIGTDGFDADVNYFSLNFCSLVDMDANDTAHVVFRTRNLGAAQVDLGTESWFSGYLVC